jgi:hypothetical protein
MLRASNISPRSAGRDIASRRRHQFVPSIGGAASTLEDRALLSAMGGTGSGVAHHLLSQSSPPNSSVGPIVADSVSSASHHSHARAHHHGHHSLTGSGGSTPAIPSAQPLVGRPLTNQSPPPNSSVGPIVANASTSTAPPNSSVGPIVANASTSSPPPNSSVGPIVANSIEFQPPHSQPKPVQGVGFLTRPGITPQASAVQPLAGHSSTSTPPPNSSVGPIIA